MTPLEQLERSLLWKVLCLGGVQSLLRQEESVVSPCITHQNDLSDNSI